jgi:formiminoglutamase
MELSEYFEPIDYSILDKDESPNTYGNLFKIFSPDTTFPNLEEIDLVILGVPEERGAYNNKGCKDAARNIRSKLYGLYCGDYKVRIADIGNLKVGETVEDTYIAVAEVCATLMKQGIIPIIIGGSHDITFPQYKAYKALGQMINIVSVDSHFDLGTNKCELNSRTYLGKIITDEPNFLFNFSNIGFQSYFVGSESIQLMKKLYFDVYRLGQVRTDLEEVEPIIRNADMMTFDISSIRQSDAPGNENASPNGFYGEEVCQIIRYAGLTEKLSSIGFYEVNPKFDSCEQTSFLVSQMIWYFIDGFYNRKNDDPSIEQDNFIKYLVNVKSMGQELIFLKSKNTDRWWMEMPHSNKDLKYLHQTLIPCSYKDYQSVANDEISDRWWNSYHKFN